MVFFSAFGGEEVILRQGLSLCSTASTGLNSWSFASSSKVLGYRHVPPWLASSPLFAQKLLPQHHLICASVSSFQVEKSILVRWQLYLFLLLFTNTKIGKGAKIKTLLVHTRISHSPHEYNSVQSNFPYKYQEGPVGLEGHPIGIQWTASNHDSSTRCCFTAFLIHLQVT